MNIARKLLNLLDAQDRRKLYLLIALSAFTGLLQTVSIASIMPFLAVVANPEAALENRWVNLAYTTLDFDSTTSFLIFLGIGVFCALAIGNGAMALNTWLLLRFSWMLGHHLALRLMTDYLYRPYEFFLTRNSAELGVKILSEIWDVVQSVVLPVIKTISNSINALFIVTLLIIVDPVLAIAAAVVLGGLYGGIFLIVRRKLTRLGQIRVKANRNRYQAAGEAFGGIKDVKVLGREQTYLHRFANPSRRFATARSTSDVISAVPGYALELVAFGGILLIVLYLLAAGGQLAQVLPVLGLYAFASYRLKPALQNVFTSVARMRSGMASFNAVRQDLRAKQQFRIVDRQRIPRLPLNERLELNDLSFWYEGAKEPVFSDLNMTIRANTSVAFVGATGSGKTTLADIIMGLLKPQRGTLKIDGQPLDDERLMAWQNNTGYVAQHIYLSDISVAFNIAFGVPKSEIDMEAVERAAKLANIHDFIVNELPNGYETIVGERGVRLSGGQRQRIGIARALYHNPDVLVLDEATSALDGVTEESIFSAVNNDIKDAKTIIMIAHRLSTVRDCDVIYLLDHGRIAAQGTYDELLRTSPTFRSMALGSAEADWLSKQSRDEVQV